VISADLSPLKQAEHYWNAGVRHISVLTEEDFFGGSIDDLITVREAYPDAWILRKDFLTHEGDIEAAYKIGADAVLLIAALLSQEQYSKLYLLALEYGPGSAHRALRCL
jgi:indole-3-glycerol phosphate synthase